MSKIVKKRLDILVSEKFKFTISDAEMQVRSGNILVNSNKIFLPSLKFSEDSKIEIINQKEYVSRGSYKLLKAIQEFKLNPEDFICLDLGASTGGFVDVLLKYKAKKVYAVDVGQTQLHNSLVNNKKVINYDKTNLKDLELSYFDEKLDFITCDVSFISLKYVFEVAKKLLDKDKQIVVLIKPQFEASSKYVEIGGYVDEQYHPYLIEKVKSFASDNEFNFNKITKSPITGTKSKNIEYLALFTKR
ncbi:TlyA family RNA methyltransferase [Mycoplasma miroungirhinis]|uniref:TlyA family RNA methyltransferase n=1 Tax=Mycoplasma miroungirhinis TaxID=754516 RepID=A0A6M4JD07_9MOLU|nr:TlyA family RNA methyltransferase [Mycoplasma miroungirhinis]QJR43959.1 TlyA family RNA methyltransferase [Mycoplasma miroungirhinis]